MEMPVSHMRMCFEIAVDWLGEFKRKDDPLKSDMLSGTSDQVFRRVASGMNLAGLSRPGSFSYLFPSRSDD